MRWIVLFLALAPLESAKAEDPCRKIRLACHAAGERPPMRCVRAVLGGAEVPGVKVDAAAIEACKAKKDKRSIKKPGKKGEKKTAETPPLE